MGAIAAFDGTGEQATVTILPDESDRDETKFDDAVVGLAVDESLLVVGSGHARRRRRADPARDRRDRQRRRTSVTGTG